MTDSTLRNVQRQGLTPSFPHMIYLFANPWIDFQCKREFIRLSLIQWMHDTGEVQ